MVVQIENVPYKVFAGLRGTRPYALNHVLRQLGGKQELPQIAYMRKFATDHENGRVAFAKDMHRMWRFRRVLVNLYQTCFVQNVRGSTKNG